MFDALKRTMRRVPLLYPLLHRLYVSGFLRFADRRVYVRHRLVRAIRKLSLVIAEEKLAGGMCTADGEYFLRMPDGIFLYYNYSDPRYALGDGQSLEFSDANALPELERFIERSLGNDAVYMDVGANNGYFYSLKVAQCYPDCRVHAFEPDARSLFLLNKNIAFNGAGNITVVPVALADYAGTGSMPAGAGASGYLLRDGASGVDPVEVRVRTLDDYVREQGIERLDLIKIDIEGGEYRFAQGARSALARFKPTLILELNDDLLRRSRASAAELNALLRDLGYRGYRIGRGNDALFVARESAGAPSPADETWLTPLA